MWSVLGKSNCKFLLASESTNEAVDPWRQNLLWEAASVKVEWVSVVNVARVEDGKGAVWTRRVVRFANLREVKIVVSFSILESKGCQVSEVLYTPKLFTHVVELLQK